MRAPSLTVGFLPSSVVSFSPVGSDYRVVMNRKLSNRRELSGDA